MSVVVVHNSYELVLAKLVERRERVQHAESLYNSSQRAALFAKNEVERCNGCWNANAYIETLNKELKFTYESSIASHKLTHERDQALATMKNKYAGVLEQLAVRNTELDAAQEARQSMEKEKDKEIRKLEASENRLKSQNTELMSGMASLQAAAARQHALALRRLLDSARALNKPRDSLSSLARTLITSSSKKNKLRRDGNKAAHRGFGSDRIRLEICNESSDEMRSALKELYFFVFEKVCKDINPNPLDDESDGESDRESDEESDEGRDSEETVNVLEVQL